MMAGEDEAAPFRREGAGFVLRVRLTPRGGRDSLDGVAVGDDGRGVVLARVRAIPSEGEANAALLRLVAKTLGVSRSAVTLVSGGKSRVKTLRIGDPGEAVAARLAALCAG